MRGLARLGLGEAARGHRRRAQADAARDHRLFRVVRDGVLVDRDVRLAEHRLGFLAGDALGAQIHQHHVAFGAAADDAQAALLQRLGHRLGVLDHLLLVRLEPGAERFLERHRLGGDHVHQRAALQAGEDGAVDGLLVLGLHQDDAAARAAQALVRGGGDHVGVGHRVGVHAGGDQAGVVRHVDHEDGADLARHTGKALEVDAQAVGAGPGDDQPGPVLARLGLHRVVVDLLAVVQAVGDDVEPLARHVQCHAVRQVPALRQAHAHDGVAGLEEGEEHRLVGAGAAVRLHVGGLGAKQPLDAVDGQLLGHVHVLAAAVVALARVALGVLVGQLRALRGHHRGRGVVFAGDQLDVGLLAGVLGLDGGPQLGVGLFDEDLAAEHGSHVVGSAESV